MKRIYVLVAVDLKEECSDEDVQAILQDVDYSFTHRLIEDAAIDDFYERRPISNIF